MVQQVKNPPVIQETMETWVRSLGWDDPLEEENVNPLQYFLPEKSHGQRSLVGYSPKGCKELDTTKWVSMHAHTVPIFQVLKQKFLGYLLLLDAFMLFYLFLLTTLQGSGYYSHLIQLRKLRVGQLLSNKVRIWTYSPLIPRAMRFSFHYVTLLFNSENTLDAYNLGNDSMNSRDRKKDSKRGIFESGDFIKSKLPTSITYKTSPFSQ